MVLDVNFDEVFENVMMNAVIAGCKGDGVLDGLTVSENGAGASMHVDVAAGNAWINSTKYTEAAITEDLVITAAHATLDRKDIVVYDASGSIPAVVTGTAAATPEPPDIPAGDVLLAIVDVGAAVTQITNADITDGRIAITTPAHMNTLIAVIGSGSYTGNSTANRAIAHGLGRIPKAVFFISGSSPAIHTRLMYGTSYMDTLTISNGYFFSVTQMNTTNFYVGWASGYDLSANYTGYTYYWVALG